MFNVDDCVSGVSEDIEILLKVTQVHNLIVDTVAKLLYYDRKEDEDLGVGEIEKLIEDGVISVDMIVDKFRRELEKAL